jgi:hypothetical protein
MRASRIEQAKALQKDISIEQVELIDRQYQGLFLTESSSSDDDPTNQLLSKKV